MAPYIQIKLKHNNDTDSTVNKEIDLENEPCENTEKNIDQNNTNDNGGETPPGKGDRSKSEMLDIEIPCPEDTPKQAPDQRAKTPNIVKPDKPTQSTV